MAVEKREKLVKDYTLTMKLGTVLVLTVAVISSIFGAGIAFQKIWSRLDHLTGKTAVYKEDFDKLENRVDVIDVQYGKIETCISNLDDKFDDVIDLLKVK